MKKKLNTPLLIFSLSLTQLFCPSVIADQVCNNDITATTPSSNFTANGDGTVTDVTTGLMWMRCSLGQTWNSSSSSCDDIASTYTWSEAFSAAEGSVFAGHSDWRVPNIKALNSIVEIACYNPSINETAFPNTLASSYRSSSPANNPNYSSLEVYFYNGSDAFNKTSPKYVRLVRGGQ